MKLTVIGCWAAYPRVNQACSGYLIEQGGTRILMDCGHSVCSKLGLYTGIEKLDAVVISHYHPDHYGDLYALSHAVRSAIFRGIRKQPLQVYLPGESDAFKYFSGKSELQVNLINDRGIARTGELNLEFYQARHIIPGFAVKVSAHGSELFYTGDTTWDENLVRASAGVKALLIETTMVAAEQEFAVSRGHMSTQDVVKWGHTTCPQLLVATHFWEGYDPEQIEAELSVSYGGRFIMAREGLEIII
jgi:ribonuclease BN (tRNA processing enzyme)